MDRTNDEDYEEEIQDDENDEDADYNEEEYNETPRSNNNEFEMEEEVEGLEQQNGEGEQEEDDDARNENFQEEDVEEEDDGGDEDIGDDEPEEPQAVTVIVRIRPLLPDEEYTPEGEKATVAVSLPHQSDQNKIRVIAKEGTQFESVLECGYDRVLDMNTTQTEVFETTAIKPAVLGVAHGISACIFAYGQTSSGKTHTMLGNDEYGRADKADMQSTNDVEWGVIPRSVAGLFTELDSQYAKQFKTNNNENPESSSPSLSSPTHHKSSSKSSFHFTVYCSMLQIYNEQLHDLLSSSALYGEGEPLSIREVVREGRNSDHDDENGVKRNTELYVQGLSSFRVSNVDDVLSLLKHGARCRAVRATELNEVSSRSHAILQLLVETQSKDEDGVLTIRRAKLSMVDLAGSEKMNVAKDAPHMTKRHLQELTSINKSLSCLGNVIAVLADKSSGKIHSNSHVPYRDSKLTRLLQDSLGGSTRTVVIACICPSSSHGSESISTLKFADRARKVMARIVANEIVDDSVLLARAKLEIKRLQKIINMLRAREAKNGGDGGGGNQGYNDGSSYENGSLNDFDGTFNNNPNNEFDDDYDRVGDNIRGGGNNKSSSDDVYTRQLRLENLKLKEENRKLKEKCKKLKSLSSSIKRSTSSSSKGYQHNGYLDINNMANQGTMNDLYHIKQPTMNQYQQQGQYEQQQQQQQQQGQYDHQETLEELGRRVKNLEMRKRIDKEFNKPLLPLEFQPLLNQYEQEYKNKGAGYDSDESEKSKTLNNDLDVQINILKNMNKKLNKNKSYHENNDNQNGEDEEDNVNSTIREEKMLDILMNTHEQLRHDAHEEGDKLISLRSEREELERQLRLIQGGANTDGDGGGDDDDGGYSDNVSIPSVIQETDEMSHRSHSNDDDDVLFESRRQQYRNKQNNQDDGTQNNDDDEGKRGFLPANINQRHSNKSNVKSAPSLQHSHINHAGSVVRSNTVGSTNQMNEDTGSRSSRSQKKNQGRQRNKQHNNDNDDERIGNDDKVKDLSSSSSSLASSFSSVKAGVTPLITGGGGGGASKGGIGSDKNALCHSTADVGVKLKLYSYRFDDYFDATIGDYDQSRKLHLCNYDSGEKQWHDLSRKRLVVVSKPSDMTQDNSQGPKSSPRKLNHKTKNKKKRQNNNHTPTSTDQQDNMKKSSSSSKNPYYPPLSDPSSSDNRHIDGVKMPPSIFGVRPNSRSLSSRSRPSSSSSNRPMSRDEANELLKNSPYSPYLTDPSLLPHQK